MKNTLSVLGAVTLTALVGCQGPDDENIKRAAAEDTAGETKELVEGALAPEEGSKKEKINAAFEESVDGILQGIQRDDAFVSQLMTMAVNNEEIYQASDKSDPESTMNLTAIHTHFMVLLPKFVGEGDDRMLMLQLQLPAPVLAQIPESEQAEVLHLVWKKQAELNQAYEPRAQELIEFMERQRGEE